MNLRRFLAALGGLAAAGGGGALFTAAGIPIGWVLGALVATALWTNAVGAPPLGPRVRRAGQLVLGCATASILTPYLLSRMLGALPAMVFAALVANAIALAIAAPFARLARVDRVTALLSVLPAGLAEMAGLAQDRGGRVDVVTLAHTTRVTLIVILLPVLVGTGPPPPAVTGGALWSTLACFAISLGLAWAMHRGGLLNPWIVVPVVVGAAMTLLGLRLGPLPPAVIIAAQVLIGGSLGARISFARVARLPRALFAAVLSTLALYAGTAACLAPVLGAVYDVDLATFALALAPGGLAEMLAAAKAIGAAVPLVLGFQLARSLLTNTLAPWLLARATRA